MVIGDEPGCEANIGRFVQVLEQASFVMEPGHWWSIKPVGDPTWMCFSPERGRAAAISSECTRVAINDLALRPIRGLPRELETFTDTTSPVHQPLEA